MLRHLALTLLAATCVALPVMPAPSAFAQTATIVGPSRILTVDADTVFVMAAKAWQSSAVSHQEKLLRHSLRLAYWRSRISSDMRRVFDALGYPTGRVLSQPTVGHVEEAWYYDQLSPPLRFRDGALLDGDRFDKLRSRG